MTESAVNQYKTLQATLDKKLSAPDATANLDRITTREGVDFVRGLKCRLCGKQYGKEPLNFCTEDFGPLEVDYHYDAIARVLNRDVIGSRPKSIWKYRELLPIESDPVIGLSTGATPLVRAKRLGSARRPPTPQLGCWHLSLAADR